MKTITISLSALLFLSSRGLSSLATIPMRITGTVASFVPGIGEGIDDKLTKTADIIDIVAE